LALGLAANIGLNFALIPAYGLFGAVLATGAATCLCLASVLEMSRWHGMRIDGGTWLLCLAPGVLGLGAWPACVAAAGAAALSLATNQIFTPSERRNLRQLAAGWLTGAMPRFRRRAAANG
jgi:peptidoglycan biosynthesis protein MviN/MurJ (putative lipid II flippase)